ncbi:MAG: hypothetical protein E4H40_02975 [Candidatus Brocadiia bacterium]|nr:MAG: hypothetical protein E4H40_02975 [Candidatus Brocadiia bacterium]
MKERLEQIAIADGRYSPLMVKFVYEGLSYTVKDIIDEPTHVNGQTLCEGLRRLALEKWGRLAVMALNSGGIKTTRDFGEIVYLLIEHKWMSAQPNDMIEDFDDVFDFQTTFKEQFEF